MLAFSFLHISFIGTTASVALYGSMKFFHLKIALGLALGESWPMLAQPRKNTDVHKGTLLWESFPKQTCKNYLRRKQFFCASHGIDPNMLSSGHHDCSTKAVVLCTADKLQCWPMLARNGTYWRMLAFSFLHISFIGTTASVALYGSIKIFHLKIALGLALGESWPLLAQPQKNTDVHKGIDPNKSNSGHHDCSTKAVFLRTADKLQCWPMLARNGTYWRMLAFSFLHISFIGTNSFSGSIWFYQIKFFHLKMALGLALGESWPLLAQPQKNTDVHKGMLLWESFPKQTCKNYLRRKQGSKLMDQIQTVV